LPGNSSQNISLRRLNPEFVTAKEIKQNYFNNFVKNYNGKIFSLRKDSKRLLRGAGI